MPPEIVALIDKPYLLISVLAVGSVIGIVAGMTIEGFLSDKQRAAWRAKNRARWKKRAGAGVATGPWLQRNSSPDAADQLRIVMSATFSVRSVLNKSEARVFKELDRMVIDRNPLWQVMAQVSLGEILSSKDRDAYSCINAKRVDLLLMDDDCQPRHAIEYQGDGHHRGTAAARDAVKKEALRRAGIGYHEIFAGHTTPSDLRQLVDKLVDKADARTALPATGNQAQIESSSLENAGQPWSPDDDVPLLQLFHRGEGVGDLASRFKRTEGAITARLERLGAMSLGRKTSG